MKSLRPERANKFAARFISNGFNSSQAVVDCGITTNRASAGVIGHRLLKNVKVKRAVERHLQMSKLSADEVIEKLTEVATSEVAEIKASDKLKALELLGKFHKLFTDRVDHTVQFDGAFTKLRGEFPDVAEDELRSWLADMLGITNSNSIEQKGTIG